MKVEICPECGSKEIECNHSECLCRDCGFVIDDSMPKLDAYREGTSSVRPVEVDGKIVKASWLKTSKQKNLRRARGKIRAIVDRLSLPKYIKDQAYAIYEKAVNKDLCIGRNKESILHASIYAVCKQNSIPKTALEITEYSDIEEKQLLKAYSLLQKELGVKAQLTDPIDILPRFVSNLGLSHKCLTKAMQLMQKIKGTAVYSGKNPKSIAAALIYISAKLCKEKISQRLIANEMGVMEVTIRKRYKEIVDELGIGI